MPSRVRFVPRLIALGAALFALALPALAQKEACVHLKVGAGYVAKMRIVSGDFHTDWSGSFAINDTKCQSLDGVAIGNEFSVQVDAVAGKTVTCKPSLKRASGDASVTYEAWGTTLKPKCEMPGEAGAQAEKPKEKK